MYSSSPYSQGAMYGQGGMYGQGSMYPPHSFYQTPLPGQPSSIAQKLYSGVMSGLEVSMQSFGRMSQVPPLLLMSWSLLSISVHCLLFFLRKDNIVCIVSLF
jgi:hypothetical protein